MSNDPSLQAVRKRLARLRRVIRTALFIEGSGVALAAMTGFVFLSLVIDYFAHMDVAQRTVLLVLAVGIVAGLIYRYMVRPLCRTISEEGLCLEIENRYGELREGLITAIQLSKTDPGSAARTSSPAMIREAIRSGLAATSGVDFAAVVNTTRRNRYAMMGLAAAAIVLASVLLAPSTMSIWARRNLLLGSVQWPRETTLVVKGMENGRLAVPRQANLDLTVEAQPGGVIPHEVLVQSRPLNGGRTRTASMAQIDPTTFQHTFKSVQDPFQLRVRGNDHTTDWVPVRVLERPEVEKLRLTVQPPDYVDKDQIRLLPGQSAYRVLAGSAVRVQGVASKALKSVRISRNEQRVTRIDGKDGTQFSTTLQSEQVKDGRYGVHLIDVHGIPIVRPAQFVIRIRKDRKPDVRARAQGIGEMILSGAVIPLKMRFKDDYDIAQTGLISRVDTGEGDLEQQSLSLPGLESKVTGTRAEFRHTSRVELNALDLQPGQALRLHVQARDNDTVSGPKTGRSGTMSFRVVTPQELRGEMLRKEQELHQQFERMLNDQKELRQTCRILLADIGDSGAVTSGQREKMARLARGERKMGRRNADLAERFRALVAEVRNNRLEQPGGPLQTRLKQQIISPVQRLARELTPRAGKQFTSARGCADTPQQCLGDLEKANATQNRIIELMKEVEQNMAKSETVHEAVRTLKQILKKQRELKEATQKQRKEGAEEIFE